MPLGVRVGEGHNVTSDLHVARGGGQGQAVLEPGVSRQRDARGLAAQREGGVDVHMLVT